MVYITVEDVETLCQYSTRLYRGRYGLLDRGKLESAVESVQATWGGKPLLQTVEAVASAYWFGICQAHAFIDGNKRASLLAVDRFLHLNGLELDLSPSEAERLTMEISKGEIAWREDLEPQIRVRPLTPLG